jgi:predicted GNAT family acetyltransferase
MVPAPSTSAFVGETGRTAPEVIELTATVKDGEDVVATCTAHLLERRETPAFQSVMDASSDELGELARDLFTVEGRLLPRYRSLSASSAKDEDSAQGSQGVWGGALDSNDILLFGHVKVDSAHRRRGMAQSLVASVKKKAARISSDFAAFVAPGAVESEYRGLEGEDRQRAIARQVDVAVQFWHAQGFRRVGDTNWLALKQ